jgi:hypothetical protein
LPSSKKYPPASVFIKEAERIVKEAKERGLVLRIMGAIAIHIHCPKFAGLHRKLERLGERMFPDIDFMSIRESRKKLPEFFEGLGYTCNKAVMAIFGLKRHIYYGSEIPMIDVFFEKLSMCHEIDFRDRIKVDYPTVSLADLLLGKMQIVKINLKDIKDTVVLLREHGVGESDDETVNSKYIAKLLSKDWGFYYTMTTNLRETKERLPTLKALNKEDISDVRTKIDELLEAIERQPKSIGWRMRAKIGTKKKWYEEVEEVVR